MKFCKSLQRVVEISHPDWVPYWTNYKLLKKAIKELPSIVPEEKNSKIESPLRRTLSNESNKDQKKDMNNTPAEVAFFKLLHAELRKANRFFENVQQEYVIREKRVVEGMALMQNATITMVNDKYSLVCKSIFRLYRDLLLLETYAIMNFCAYSKILKKHDKNTGFETRAAFMENVVSKTSFAEYPNLLAMINRCQKLYEQASSKLIIEGKESLYEDERLFIGMISRLNSQVIEDEERTGIFDESRLAVARPSQQPRTENRQESEELSTLRSIVEENDAHKVCQVSHAGDEDEHNDSKRPADSSKLSPSAKKRRNSDDDE